MSVNTSAMRLWVSSEFSIIFEGKCLNLLDIWNGGMKDDFTYLKQRYPSYKLWVIGHSLGGAMASLCSSYIVANGLFASVDVLTLNQLIYGNTKL